MLLVYSPIRERVHQSASQDMADQDIDTLQYQAESELIMTERIRPWLRMVHTITPGASILLVCSHLESPPQGDGRESSEWIKHVQRLACCVYGQVGPYLFTALCSTAHKVPLPSLSSFLSPLSSPLNHILFPIPSQLSLFSSLISFTQYL